MACEKCECSIRVRYCGEEWIVVSDSNDDGVLEVGFEPRLVDYTGAEPDPALAIVLPDPADESILPSGVFAVNSDGEVTHIAVCGRWLPVAGGSSEATVPPDEAERVCYPVAAWFADGPVSFGGGCDLWSVNGQNVADDVCPVTPVSFCPDGALFVNYGTGAQGVPAGGWAQLNWAPLPGGFSGCAASYENANTPREAVRVSFPVPAGTVSASVLATMSVDVLDGDGTFVFGVYDSVADAMVPIESYSAPASAIISLQDNNTALYTHPQNSPSLLAGTYQLNIDPDGLALEDLELIVWQLGDNDSNEEFGNVSFSFETDAGDGCFTWNNAAALASWMNTKHPDGLAGTWFVNGDGDVCADVPIGIGNIYGDLGSCSDGTVAPAIV